MSGSGFLYKNKIYPDYVLLSMYGSHMMELHLHNYSGITLLKYTGFKYAICGGFELE